MFTAERIWSLHLSALAAWTLAYLTEGPHGSFAFPLRILIVVDQENTEYYCGE